MKTSNIQKPIAFFKNHGRCDEVVTLFFAITMLCFLIISFTRLSFIGKFCDDLCFNFIFGWVKYLIYGFSIFVIVPLFFAYYLKLKIIVVIKLLILLVLSCWTVQTLALIVNNENHLHTNYYNLNLIHIITKYVNMWWNNSIFTNYHDFFVHPISFTNFSVTTFFPKYATGGMISTILTGMFSYGFFTDGWP